MDAGKSQDILIKLVNRNLEGQLFSSNLKVWEPVKLMALAQPEGWRDQDLRRAGGPVWTKRH